MPARLLLPQPGAARLYGLLGVASLAAGAFLGGVVLRPGSGVFEALPDGVRALLLTHVQVGGGPLGCLAETLALVH